MCTRQSSLLSIGVVIGRGVFDTGSTALHLALIALVPKPKGAKVWLKERAPEAVDGLTEAKDDGLQSFSVELLRTVAV